MKESIVTVASKITVQDGVFSPDGGSMALAAACMELQGSFLEVGTGSGFIAIALAANGRKAAACDVSPAAVECARINASNAGVDVPVFVSDLFGNVTGKFDVIIFNPPTNASESEEDRHRKNRIKKLIPKAMWKPVSATFQAMHASNRRKFLKMFITQAWSYLQPQGSIVMNIVATDWNFIQRLNNKNMSVSKVNNSPGCIQVKITMN